MKLIYSVCLGDYDVLPPVTLSAGFRHMLFTDNPNIKAKGWELFHVEPWADLKKQSRHIKLCVHQYIQADLYLYFDANYEVLRDLKEFVRCFFFGGFTAIKHPHRRTIADEAERIIELGKADEIIVRRQVSHYKAEGMEDDRLFANGFFIRDSSFDSFFEAWYAEIDEFTHRDQLSLPYLVWKYQPKMTVVDWKLKTLYLRLHPHAGNQKGTLSIDTPKVWYFVPGAGDKNYGAALNRHCALVPDDDWILVRDNDTMFLQPFINKQIEDIIAKHGSRFDLLSCYTNRLGIPEQCPYGLMQTPNLLELHALAEKHYTEHYDEVARIEKPTAGLFMLFPKKTWLAHPFEEGLAEGDFIDYRFSNGLLQKGMKLGICTGIFLAHFYRLNKHHKDISHLKMAG